MFYLRARPDSIFKLAIMTITDALFDCMELWLLCLILGMVRGGAEGMLITKSNVLINEALVFWPAALADLEQLCLSELVGFDNCYHICWCRRHVQVACRLTC